MNLHLPPARTKQLSLLTLTRLVEWSQLEVAIIQLVYVCDDKLVVRYDVTQCPNSRGLFSNLTSHFLTPWLNLPPSDTPSILRNPSWAIPLSQHHSVECIYPLYLFGLLFLAVRSRTIMCIACVFLSSLPIFSKIIYTKKVPTLKCSMSIFFFISKRSFVK